MKRRNFLYATGLLSVQTWTGIPGLLAANSLPLQTMISGDDDRVLVVIQLFGGNDGLNTLVPVDQMDGLTAVRPLLVMPPSSLIGLNDSLYLHGSMQGMKQLFDDEKLSIIQSVGYPNQNRSHFRSSEIYATASAAEEELTTGWLGRYFDTKHAGYPSGYPNSDYPHPVSLSLSHVAHASCEGVVTNYSQAIIDPENLTFVGGSGEDALPDDLYGAQLGFLRTAYEQADNYGEVVKQASTTGQNQVDYPNSDLGRQLRDVARLLHGGLRTKVFTVGMGGFDTHASQVNPGEAQAGSHAILLQELSSAITAFTADLNAMGLAERVLGMTYSEFGRRIRSNASYGTDHGDAGPMFIFGGCAGKKILGHNVVVDPDISQSDAVPMQFDFRDVYGSVLVDWFGAEPELVRQLIHPGFSYLPVLSDCATTATDPAGAINGWSINEPYPNPADGVLYFDFVAPRHGSAEILLSDFLGRRVHNRRTIDVRPGHNHVEIDVAALRSGAYSLTLSNPEGMVWTKKAVVR